VRVVPDEVQLPDNYFQDLNDCTNFMQHYLTRWGRIGAYTKVKWGRIDVSSYFGIAQLHSLTHPGYAYSQYPKWLWQLDCTYISKLFSPFQNLIFVYQCWIYRQAYRTALKRWPHLRGALLAGTDQSELLGKEFGIHYVRDSKNGYTIYRDWHPDELPVVPEY
jgi:hypothetical protein